MRQRLKQIKKGEGPLGIRTAVWLSTFGLMLVGVLTIHLSRQHREPPAGEIASAEVADQDSLPLPQARVRRAAHREVTPNVCESGVGCDKGEALFSMIEQMIQDRRTWMDNPE